MTDDALRGPGRASPWGPRLTADPLAAAERLTSVPSIAVQSAQPSGSVPVTFTGEAGTLFGILARGFALQLVTLGIYRFWLTTELRRYYWSHVAAGQETPVYTGTGLELFKGFLVALAIILPIKAAAFLLALSIPSAEMLISIGVGVLYLFLGQFAVYAGRRYRLARTSWRGLRFRMTGSAWRYALIGFGWSIIVILSLGLAYPFAAAALERIKMRETWFGSAQGGFTGSAMTLFRRGIIAWAIGIGIPIVLLITSALYFSAADWRGLLALGPGGIERAGIGEGLALVAVIASLSFATFILPVLVYPAFAAIVFRWRMEGSTIGGASLASTFSVGRSYRVFGLGILALMGVVFAISVAFGFVMAIVTDVNKGPGAGLIIAAIVGYLAIFGGMWIAKQMLIDLRLWRAQMTTLAVMNLASLDSVLAENADASAMGDSLGGAIDIGVGL